MRKPRILVSGATGKTGTPTVMQLLEKGYPVRALVRRIDHRSEKLRQAGAEIVLGSLEDLVDLRTSMSGVQRAYFCPPLEAGTLRRATLFAAAAQEARLEAVVALSQWLVDPVHPSLHAREKWLSGKVLGWIPGVDVVTINPGWFADNYMAVLESASQFGIMAMPLGQGLNAPPSNEDVARVIVGALTNPAPHAGKSFRPTGPTLLAPEEIASILGRVLGRKVKYQDAPVKLFRKVARSIGVSDFVITQLDFFLQDYRRNSFGVGAPTSAVLEVGGASPEDFETIARRYVATSPFSRRSVASTFKAVGNIARALLTSAPDPESIARRLQIPRIDHAALAADSAGWRSLHGSENRELRTTPSPYGKI